MKNITVITTLLFTTQLYSSFTSTEHTFLGAAAHGNGTVVQTLIPQVNINMTREPWLADGGNTALHYLVQYNTPEAKHAIIALLKAGAEQIPNRAGKTPDDLACEQVKPLLSPSSK